MLVMPGGIDPHTHLHPTFADDLTSGTQAALAGGITTVGTFSIPNDKESLVAALDRHEAEIRRDAIADVFLHSFPWPPTPETIASIPTIAERGQPSIKLFMADSDFSTHVAEVVRILEVARDAGIVTMIHCEDGVLLEAAVRRLTERPGVLTVNLGTGRGYSVIEVVKAFEKASGRPVPYEIVARRPGDVAQCYAEPSLAEEELGWRASRGIDEMCADSWRWQSSNPQGYTD